MRRAEMIARIEQLEKQNAELLATVRELAAKMPVPYVPQIPAPAPFYRHSTISPLVPTISPFWYESVQNTYDYRGMQ